MLYKIAFKQGLVAVGIAAAFSVLFLILGLYDSIFNLRFKTDLIIYYVAIILFVIIAIRRYKKAHQNSLKLSQAITIGLVLVIIAALGYILYSFVFINVLKPDYNTNYYYGTFSKQAWQHYYEINPEEHTRESYDINAKGALQREYNFVYPFILVASIIMGLLTSFITGLLMQTKPSKIKNNLEGVQRQPLYKFTIKYGLILAIIPTIYNIILVILELHLDYDYFGEGLGESYTKARTYLLPIVLFIAIYHYKKIALSSIPFKRIIKLGLWIFIISSVTIILYNLIFRFLIEPDFSAKFYNINREQIYTILVEGHLELGMNYTQANMDTHVSRNGNIWNMLFVNLVLNFIFTLFFSLVFGLIMRRWKIK